MRIAALCLAVLLSACGAPQPPLVASEVEITRPMPGRHMSAGYLVLTNNTGEPIRITGATSPQFGKVEIHETIIADGVARMRQLDELVVPARHSVRLERGGKHLMLMRARDLDAAVSVQLLSDDAPILAIRYAFPGGTD
ncbi:MAG: copper chaperone PCu(A)C [Gammaproteobacteria bacterium]|nr:copper chaperone PCu(A)C [Gammaproteobacteria bacterium]